VLYELLAGRPPYQPASLADLADPPEIRPVSELAPDVPRRVEDAVMRALARNPAYRPASAQELARELGEQATAATRIASTGPARPRTRWWLAVPAAAAIGAVAVAVLATREDDKPPPRRPAPVAARPIPPGANAQEQARNVAAWLRARAAAP
jgi:serine/threonine-protein kinase